MYFLTLTRTERRAFDWIGGRYYNGDDMSKLLRECLGPDEEWSQIGDIKFSIPEHIAWQIAELADQNAEGGHSKFPCFAPELANKMYAFVDNIV